jgi:hypothetical protein
VCIQELGQVLGQRSQRDLQLVVIDRIEVHRPRAGEHQARERGLVTVSRHHQRLPGAGYRHDRHAYVHRRSPGREQRLLCPDRLGEQLLSGRLNLPRPIARVHAVTQRQIRPDSGWACPLGYFGLGTAAAGVRRDPKRQHVPLPISADRIRDRHAALILDDRTVGSLKRRANAVCCPLERPGTHVTSTTRATCLAHASSHAHEHRKT